MISPELAGLLAIVGVVAYIAVGALVLGWASRVVDFFEDDDGSGMIMGTLFWPLVLAILLVVVSWRLGRGRPLRRP